MLLLVMEMRCFHKLPCPRRSIRLIPALAILVLCLGGCVSTAPDKATAQKAVGVSVLSSSLDELRQQFNGDKDRVRVLALFSPT